MRLVVAELQSRAFKLFTDISMHYASLYLRPLNDHRDVYFRCLPIILYRINLINAIIYICGNKHISLLAFTLKKKIIGQIY